MSDPAILAILVCRVSKSRLAVTLGIPNVFANIPGSVSHIGATHAQSHDGTSVLVPVEGISWVPTSEQKPLGTHGTDANAWQSIVNDQAMISNNRISLCFAVFRTRSVVKEMPQLKASVVYIIIDHMQLIASGTGIIANINDVT